MSKKIIIVNGENFADLETFFDEMDRVLNKYTGWHNLAAFDNLLSGGFGVHEYEEPITLLWKNISKSKVDLGFDTTKKYYEKNIESHAQNAHFWKDELKELTDKKGQTLFETIIEIISRHKHIEFKSED
jgi:RNAse (barnase) inhibitor barstar